MKIFCTNGLKSVLIELAPALEREHAISLSTTWGATVGLAREIAGGAQADLAILTGEVVDDLIARGKAERALQEIDGPGFQRLWQESVVRIRETALCDSPRLIPVQQMLVHQ